MSDTRDHRPAPTPPPSSPEQDSPAAVRRRSWGRRVALAGGALVLLLIVLIALAPTLASTAWARGYIVSKANAALRGEVAIADWSLGWWGDCRVNGLTVRDPQQRDVLQVESATLKSGLWHALTHLNDPGHIVIVAPKATLIVNEHGELSLAQAFESKNPSPAGPPGEPLDLRTTIDVENASAEIVFADGRQESIADAAAHVELATAGALKAELTAGLAPRGRVRATLDLTDWFTAGKPSPLTASGTAAVVAEEPLDAATLDRIAALQAGLGGALGFDLNATLNKGAITGNFTLQADQLKADTRGAQLQPVDVALAGELRFTGGLLAAQTKATGDWGNLQATFSGRPDALSGVQFEPDQLAAWLAGAPAPLVLPELNASWSGEVDLAALGKALPALLHVRPGTEITAGTLRVAEGALHGGREPKLALNAELSELTARDGDRQIHCAPITAVVAAGSSPAGGLRIENATLTSGFGRLSASGTPGDVRANLATDLAELRAQLGGIFELPVSELAGAVTASVAVQRSADGAVDYDVSASATDLRCIAGETRVALAQGETQQRGSLRLPAEGLRPEQVNDAFQVRVTQLHFANGEKTVADGLDAVVSGTAKLADDALDATLDAGGAWGEFKAAVAGPLDAVSRIQIDDDLLPALLAGERRALTLPEGRADLSGRIDLARLNQVAPALLQVRAGTTIQSGQVTVRECALLGGGEPSLKLAGAVRDLVAQAGERVVRCAPITADVDAESTRARGIAVRRADLTTGFGALTAAGTPGDITASARADLAELQNQLASIFELPFDELAGAVNGSLSAKRIADDKVAVKLNAEGSNVRYSAGERRFTIGKARAAQTGKLTLAGTTIERIEASEASLALDDRIVVQAQGALAPRTGVFAGELDLRQADLAYFTRLAGAAGLAQVKPMTGGLSGKFNVARNAAGAPIQSDGALTARQLAVEGQPVVDDGACRWQQLTFSPENAHLAAAAVTVKSEPLQLAASNVSATLGDTPEAGGDVKLTGDLKLLTALLSGFGLLAEDPGVTGTVTADGKMRTSGGMIELTGSADLANFTVPEAPAAAPHTAKFNCDARVDTRQRSVAVRGFKLASQLATVNLKGTLGYGEADRTVALTGDYRLVWDDVLPVLYAFAPELRDSLALTGASADSIQISGVLPTGGDASWLSGLTARTGMGWETADLLGVALGKTQVKPMLRNAVVTLPTSTIPAASGTVRIGGAIDLAAPTPLLKMPGETAVLDQVQITPELASGLLSRFNPIFSRATQLQGTADLVVRDLELPLGKGVETGGAGGGTLTLDAFQIAPGGLLAELLTLGKLTRELYIVDVSGLVFEVRDGRIHYRDLTLSFVQDKFDLKFYGSVGFDDTVDLVVSIPIGEKVLEKVGVRTDAVDYVGLLAGLRVDVPVVGTRQNPRLDFSQVSAKSLIDEALRKQREKLLSPDGLIDLIGGLSGKKGSEGKPGGADAGGAATPAPSPTPTPAAEPEQPERKSRSGVKVGRKRTPR